MNMIQKILKKQIVCVGLHGNLVVVVAEIMRVELTHHLYSSSSRSMNLPNRKRDYNFWYSVFREISTDVRVS